MIVSMEMIKIIIDLIFQLLFAPLEWLVNLIPENNFLHGVELPTSLVSAINNVSCFVPVPTFFLLISLTIVLYNLDFIIAVIHWVIRKIPTIN